MRRSPLGALSVAVCMLAGTTTASPGPASAPIQFVFTSDAHYGLTRTRFRGAANVPARVVNAALVAAINTLPSRKLPDDGGLRAGQPIGPLDFLVNGGDITNRAERTVGLTVQSATISWRQFTRDYLEGITVNDHTGRTTPWFIVPGNHEASSAVGFHKPMSPALDNTPMVEIFNRMLRPTPPRTTVTFDYANDRVLYSRDRGGIHFVFLQVWVDSFARAWMERDLGAVSAGTPVVMFVHDQPDAEAKHFINPNGAHDINATDQFENLLSDVFADGRTIDTASLIEQRALEAFLRRHPNITAYFHGNSNWNEFYDWTGPGHSIMLHTFRVDSPMKGHFSANDETKLSFQVATIDPWSRKMTVRECLWNRPVGESWGAATTVSIGSGNGSAQRQRTVGR